MAKIIETTTDAGDVHFDADFKTGYVSVSVREPLAINKSVAKIPIPDLLEVAAQVLLASVAQSRAVQAKLAEQLASAKNAHDDLQRKAKLT